MGAGDDVTLFRDLCNLGSGGASGTVGRRKGVVTLSVEERKGPAALEISSGRDRFAPRPHRRGAEGAMRL
ncbi:MAG: hypothetical protein ABSC25_27320, partial [Roseiarcus sp.]